MLNNKTYKFFFKRVTDIIIIFLGLLIFTPIFLIVFFLAKIKVGSPIFFKQARPGLNGRIFNIYKFRTMTNEIDKDGNLLPDKDRLNNFGKFLRSTSLDELPGLWNVLKGEMSLVGPRPLLVEYLSLYSERQSRRHNVKPGLTGWAQINGRNAITWNQKLELDIYYVDNQSFWLDIKILFMTVKKVIVRDGVSHDNHVTVDKFKGNIQK